MDERCVPLSGIYTNVQSKYRCILSSLYYVFWFNFPFSCIAPSKYKHYLEFSFIYTSFCCMSMCIKTHWEVSLVYIFNLIFTWNTFQSWYNIFQFPISSHNLPTFWYFLMKTLNSLIRMTCIIHLGFETISHSCPQSIHLAFCIASNYATMLCFLYQPCLPCLSSFKKGQFKATAFIFFFFWPSRTTQLSVIHNFIPIVLSVFCPWLHSFASPSENWILLAWFIKIYLF